MKASNYKFLALVLLQAAVLMSCGKKDDGGSVAIPGRCDSRSVAACGSNTPGNAQSQVADINMLKGRFISDDQGGFQYNTAGLASATIPEAALGNVNDGSAYDGTGIAFGAKVILNGNVKITNAPAGTAIASNSRMGLGIYDSFVNQSADSTGTQIGPIQIQMLQASGSVGGGKADVIFTDDFGTIEFKGTYDAQLFTGTATYINKVKVDAPGAKGATGTFDMTIPTCAFFVCN
jgi:hypothetical protein